MFGTHTQSSVDTQMSAQEVLPDTVTPFRESFHSVNIRNGKEIHCQSFKCQYFSDSIKNIFFSFSLKEGSIIYIQERLNTHALFSAFGMSNSQITNIEVSEMMNEYIEILFAWREAVRMEEFKTTIKQMFI